MLFLEKGIPTGFTNLCLQQLTAWQQPRLHNHLVHEAH
jgi:hypothetical protein